MGNDEDAPLFQDLRVLDVGSWIAGPVAATMLADYGAQVIKIEMPGSGDPYRNLAQTPSIPSSDDPYCWHMDARNKRSLSLNLKTAAGRDILLRLAAQADVYITNQPLPMRRKLGLTWEDLAALNPRLVYASLTAYGEDGPEQDREGFDLVAYWSRSGLMDMIRAPGAEPAQAISGLGDHPSAVALYGAIVTALYARERTGRGRMVHTSLLANGLWSASCVAQGKFAGADFSNWRQTTNLQRALYPCADGRYLQLFMVRTQEETTALLDLLGLSALLTDPRFATPEARFAHGPALVAELQRCFAQQAASVWLARCQRAGVPAALVGTLDELLADPQLSLNQMVRTTAQGPSYPLIQHPVNLAGMARAPMAAAPTLGEHNGEILRELGFTNEDITRLQAQGVI